MSPQNLKHIFLVFSFLISTVYGTIAQEKKVLFLGNSYTAVNDLPSLVADLALSGGHDIYIDKNAPSGYTLGTPSNGHLYNQTSLDKIALGDWDYVVLQEQSQFPVIDFYWDNYTYPGAIALDSIIRENNPCAKTMFYMTWGRKYGGQQCIVGHCSVDFADYAHMQDSLASAYLTMSNYLETPVCPAGISWEKSIVDNGDPIELFSGDGSHPSLAGSYLTACTFYATIFQESPVGLTFTGGLGESDAAYLQNIASEIVLNNIELWNIDTTTVTAAFDFNQDGGEVTFENLSVNAEEYYWDFGNGDTDTVANPVYTYYESGSFDVSLISFSGCKADTVSAEIDIVIAQLNEVESTIPITVYPVPARDYLTIGYQLIDKIKPSVLSIIDTNGILHEKIYLNNDDISVRINIESLSDGTYFINIVSQNKVIGVAKFLIMH